MKNLKNFAATVAMLLCCITASAYDFEVEGLGYTITSADELTVSVAQGATAPTGDLVIPSTVTNEDVTYSVTAITANAFSGCSELTSITISTNITTIGSSAFSGCSGVKEVTIEDAIVALSLGTNPFASCPLEKVYLGRDLAYSSGLKSNVPFYNQTTLISLTIGDKVTVIGKYAFYGCSGLTSLTIPASVTTIDTNAFSGCTAIKELTIEDATEVLSLSTEQFTSCPLEKVYLGRDLTYLTNSISQAPFYNQTALTSVTIGEKVTAIGSCAFYGCSGLTSITIPASVVSIGSYAFSGCTAIKELTIEDGTEALSLSAEQFTSCPLEKVYLGRDLTYSATSQYAPFYNQTALSSVTISDKVTTIGSSAFYGCSGLASITIPANVTTIGSSAFSGCSGLTSISIPDGVTSINSNTFKGCSGLTSLTIPASVTSIGSGAFYGCSGLTSMIILAGVTTIDTQAFYGCSGLTSLTIPASVTSIGYKAFSYCSGLTSIIIPASVTTFGGAPFSYCEGLKEVTFADGEEVLSLQTSYQSSIFVGCPLEKIYLGRTLDYEAETSSYAPFYYQNTLTSVTIGDKVSSLGKYLFYNCENLSELTIEDSDNVLSLANDKVFFPCPIKKAYLGRDLAGYIPFYHKSLVSSVTLGDKVTNLINGLFHGCSGLTSLTIPASVTTIGSSAFSGCSGLTSLTIPASVTTIGSSAFSGCSGLTSITIPASVTSIGSSAFSDCSGIKELTIEDGSEVLTLEGSSSMFSSCPLEKVYLGRNLTYSVTSSNSSPFFNKQALTDVTIGDKVTSIFSNAFAGCSSITEVKIEDLEAWMKIDFSSVTSNPTYFSKSLYVDGELLTELVVPSIITEVKDYAFYNNTSLMSVNLGDAVTSIGSGAFYGCSGLTSMPIPTSVVTIGSSAFYDCSSLTSMTIPASVTTIGSYTFRNCSGLTSLVLGDAVTSIGDFAFQGCSGLTSLVVPAGVTTIGSYAFSNCTGLTSFTLGDAVSSIGSNAFSGCSKLKDLHIGNLDTWAAIEYGNAYSHPNYYATNIYHNDKLVTEVEIPTTVTSIPDYTYYNFGDVVKVKLHEGVESIGERAFFNVNAVFDIAATTAPTLGGAAILAPSVIVVPKEAGAAYSEADGWANLAITTDDAYKQTLTLEAVEDASALHKTLGDAKLDSVVDLTISGTINSYDFMVMRTKMTKLRNLDLTNATVKYNAYQHYTGYHTADSIVPGYAFYNCNLFDVKLPSNTKSVENYAVSGNKYLRGVELPKGMTAIGNYAFAGDSRLREVTIPEGVKTIKGNAFASCSMLENAVFPTTLEYLEGYALAGTALRKVDFSNTSLTNIGQYAFGGCTKLEEVKLPSKTLQTIYSEAFRSCTSLKEFRIPSSVRTISDNAFTGCTNLEKVYVYTVEPISIGQNTFALTGNNFVGALYAPRVSYYTYWYDTQWGQFQSVNEFDEPYEYAYFEGDTTLDPSTGTVDGDGETLPDADMGSQSGNTVNGAEATEEEEEEGGETPAAANGMRRTQAATAATLTQEWGTLNVAHNGTDGASIIAKNGGAVTAETANFRITVAEGQWYFLSFPFDIKKENIKCESGANYVFRYYDGAVRAANGSGGWANVAVADDGTYLKAGKGYIFQASKSDVLVLTVEDMSIVSEDKSTAVEAYAADNTANASWNFVGNPYLSYYNVTAADYSAPITVWNGSSYQAVRPGDDEYQLAPFEAFFVQKPEGVNDITYATTSQTTYQKIQAAAAAAPGRRTAEVNPDRLLVNITLTDGATTDQTRVVFNNSVSMEYEMECDAAKFSTAGVPQLYTIDSRAVKYAINERPVAEGIVTVGFTAPAQGNYTIAAPRMDTPMLLRDNATGTIHDFSEGSYEFASEAGTFDDRFTLMMKAGETSIDELESTGNGQQSTVIYDVAGRRVNEATEQGIYIKGNRKVVTL